MSDAKGAGAPARLKLRAVDEEDLAVVSANLQDGAAFNNRGQFVFHYRLRDGRNGVAVVTVPEPAGAAFVAALTAAGAIPLLRGRRRSRDRRA